VGARYTRRQVMAIQDITERVESSWKNKRRN
jgi:hypothetical protein